LPGVFSRPGVETKDLSTPTGRATSDSGARSWLNYLGGGAGSHNVEKAVTEGYERVLYVFACVDAYATNLSTLPMVVRRQDRDTGRTVEDPLLHRLLNIRANPYETARQFRYRAISQALLSPKGVFIERVPSKGGRTAELHLLPPGHTNPIPHPTEFVSGFRVREPNREAYRVLPPDRVLWVRIKPHPTDPYRQMTPLVAAGLAADTDFLARMFNRTFMSNDGRPGMLISVKGRVSEGDAEELKKRFSGGPGQAGRTSVIESDGIEVADMSGTPRDSQWLEAISGAKNDLLAAFGMSESFLGNASGRTFDNADAEFEITWMTKLVPFAVGFAEAFDVITVGGLEDDLIVAHDISGVDVLQRQERRRLDRKIAAFQAGLATIDDYMEEAGLAKWDVPASRVLFLPNGIAVARDDADEAAVQKLKPVAQPAVPDPSAAAQAGAERGAAIGQQHFQNIIAARAFQLAGKSGASLETVIPEIEQKKLPATQKCTYCKEQATKRVLWAEGMAYIPTCDAHLSKAKTRIEKQNHDEVVGIRPIPASKRKKALGPPSSTQQAQDAASGSPVALPAHPYEVVRAQIEGEVSGILAGWSDTQERVLEERLSHAKSLMHTRHWVGDQNKIGTKALDPQYVVELSRWLTDLEITMEPAIRRQVQSELKKVSGELASAGVLHDVIMAGRGDINGKSSAEMLLGRKQKSLVDDQVASVLGVIRTSAANQSQRMADLIHQLDADGKSMAQIKAEVKRVMGTRTSWKKGLATHVTTALVEGTRDAVLAEAHPFIERKWRSLDDQRVRPTHAVADGQVRPAGAAFKVGGALLMYPGDPTGPLSEVIACRCWLDWSPTR
jgi:HK97 family phage portal protein